MAIIYKATNVLDNTIYIGKSVVSLGIRRSNHFSDVKRGSKYHFHKALRKYGEAAFVWEVLEKIPNELASVIEKAYISLYKLIGQRLYNETNGGEGWSRLHSPETKQKISLAKKGSTPWNKGIKQSQTAKEKQKLAWKLRRQHREHA